MFLLFLGAIARREKFVPTRNQDNYVSNDVGRLGLFRDFGPTIRARFPLSLREPLCKTTVAERMTAADRVRLVHEAVADITRNELSHGIQILFDEL